MRSRLLRATADAQAIRLKGQADADAAQIMAKALETNQNLVSLRIAVTWNGVLPVNMYGAAPVPLLPLPAPR